MALVCDPRVMSGLRIEGGEWRDKAEVKGGDQMKSLFKLGAILICSLIFLISCSGSTSGGKWIKPGSDEEEFDKDYYQCKKHATRECQYTEWPGYVVQKSCFNNLMKDCLHSRGWEYRKP